MSITLYDVTVPRYQQIIGALGGVVDKAIGHCDSSKVDPSDLIATRLCSDMLAFKDQIATVILMSVGAIKAAEAGVYSPPPNLGSASYESFPQIKAALTEASAELAAIEPGRINGLEHKGVVFSVPARGLTLPFTGFAFFTSFSLPNFYFHATTAYDILRQKGVPIGKRDFLGQMQLSV